MTRRERIEARLERRREWAASREAKSNAAFNRAHSLFDGIPLGQPILVGHHSEKRHRRTIEKAHNAVRQGCESADMAKHHDSKAGGLAHQLETSIYSDDPDALECLEAKATAIEAQADRCKAINAAFRKAPGSDNAAKLTALVQAGTMTEAESMSCARTFSLCHWEKQPFPPYHLTNLRANARRQRERIKEVSRRQEVTAQAEAAPGGMLVKRFPEQNWAHVTFADKPDREILEALRGAGFAWGSGSWHGYLDKLPAAIAEIEVNP